MEYSTALCLSLYTVQLRDQVLWYTYSKKMLILLYQHYFNSVLVITSTALFALNKKTCIIWKTIAKALDLSVNACYNYFKDFVALAFPDRILRRQIHFSALAALALCFSLLSGQTITEETDYVPLGYDITAQKRRSHHEM